MLTGLLGTALLASSPAQACGGFFCDNATPVDQSGERILFALDRGAGEIEVHVQISYEGPAEDFGWILPVPTEPEVKPSVDDIFNILGVATDPVFNTVTEQIGNCPEPPRLGVQDFALAAEAPQDDAGGIVIGSQEPVGPYESTVLQAQTVDALTEWLADNSYDLPEAALERLKPYVDEGSWFVALKLAKDRDDGDLIPVALRYKGTEPVIPLQLTGVAATPDMRLQPLLLAPERAVPENYLHVEVNPLAIDWLQRGVYYLDVITRAADEAGGQAFATDYSGPVADLGVTLWSPSLYDTTPLANATTLQDYERAIGTTGIPISTGTTPILSRFIDKPANLEEVADTQFYACPGCWGVTGSLDGEGLAAAFETEWIPVMREAQGLVDAFPHFTRLTSSISADEMTVDPRFVLNPDMGDVSNVHDAVIQVECKGRFQWSKAPRRLVLEDGRELELPSFDEMGQVWESWDAWVGDISAHAAERIEGTSGSGEPMIISDNAPAIQAALDAHNEAIGCGCNSSGGALGVLPLFLVLGLRRRDGRR
jgi:hypothetical protein